MNKSLVFAPFAMASLALGLLLAIAGPTVGQAPAKRDPARDAQYLQKLREIQRLQDQIDRLIKELDAPADAPKPEAKIADDHVPAIKLDRVGSWGGGLAWNMSIGWEFETKDRVQVTELGIWDCKRDGLDKDFPVAIWDDAGKVVVSTTVPARDEAPLVGDFRYASVKPVELEAGKRYIIAALYTAKTEEGTVYGGSNVTTAAPIRWLKPCRIRGDELSRPEADRVDRLILGSFGPNFLMASSEATKKPGTYYRQRHIGWPPKQQVAVVPEKEDGSHREENSLDITLYADHEGRLTQIVMNDKPLGVGEKALETIAAERKGHAELTPELRPILQVAAMDSVKKEDREAVAKFIDRDYLDPGVAREHADGIIPLAKARIKQPAHEGEFPVADRFKDHGEYIEDRWTGLLWQKDGLAAGKRNFYEAKEYAEKLELGEMKGWRVPKIEELRTIFPATFAPFKDTKYTPKQCCAGPEEFASYWTSELDGRADDYAFVFHWYAGGGANNCFASKNFVYVRCVHDPIPGRK